MAKKIKVSQKTIDSIKKLGMTEALKLAGKNGNPAGGTASEYQEGIRRMYGAKRLDAAKAKYAPVKSKSPDAARAGVTKPAPKPVAKSADAARAGTTKVKPTVKPQASNTKSNVLKATAGAAAAVGTLALSKGKAVGLASKLSPAIGSLAKSGVGKAIFGKAPKISQEAYDAMKAAKAGKAISESGYKAMQAAAKAKGIKAPTADAAKKAAATKPKAKIKTAKAGIAASGAGQTKK